MFELNVFPEEMSSRERLELYRIIEQSDFKELRDSLKSFLPKSIENEHTFKLLHMCKDHKCINLMISLMLFLERIEGNPVDLQFYSDRSRNQHFITESVFEHKFVTRMAPAKPFKEHQINMTFHMSTNCDRFLMEYVGLDSRKVEIYFNGNKWYSKNLSEENKQLFIDENIPTPWA